jgi:hypothetical protein
MEHLFSRRSLFLKIASTAGASLPSLGIAKGGLLWNGGFPRANPATPKVVCFFLDGGLSHLDSFDPKPQASVQHHGELGMISTSLSGVGFSELWPRMAEQAHRLTVLRSLQHRHNEHGVALRCMHTLQQSANRYTPSIGSVVQWQSQSHSPLFVTLPETPDYSGSLGTEYRAFSITGPVGQAVARSGDPSASTELGHRTKLLEGLNRIQVNESSDPRRLSLVRQQQKIRDIYESSVFQQMVDISRIPESIKQKFGDSKNGRLALLAHNAVEAGMQFTLVNFPGWDMHTQIFQQMRSLAPATDQAIAAFLEQLKASDHWDSTVVLIMSEFGRSPLIEAGAGRGHWPKAMSILVAGGPVPQGKVIGDTGPNGYQSEVVSHQPEDLLASLYRWLRLDWDVMLPGEGARLNTAGSPIPELGIG